VTHSLMRGEVRDACPGGSESEWLEMLVDYCVCRKGTGPTSPVQIAMPVAMRTSFADSDIIG